MLVTARSAGLAQSRDFFTTSFQNDAIGRYDGSSGAFKGYFVSQGSGGLDQPQKILFHPQTDHMLVTGFFNNSIKAYDGNTGAYLGDFSSGYSLSSPTKMILGHDDLLYVSQWGGKIVRFDLSGVFVDEFSSISIPAGLGMEWDDAGNLYVASWGTDGFDGQVYKFDSLGNSLGTFINSSELDGPVGIWREEAGDFLVVDWRKGSVLRFDSSGAFKGTFISGNERIEGHAFGTDGSIYLCNVQIDQVKRYDASGNFLSTFIDDSNLAGANDIVLEPETASTSNDPLAGQKRIQLQLVPSPFREALGIHLELPVRTTTSITITDVLGRRHKTLKEGMLPVGAQQFVWEATDAPAGVYFVLVQAGEQRVVQRVIKQ